MNILKNILKKSENKFGDNKKVSNFATPFEMMGKQETSSLKILKKVRKE
ncbi:MAG TPA: hypothetical protein PKN48_15610 [Bacteroidales bacterium]|nr:hypothetical protein [Bacteroidales bacterium]